MAGGGELRLLTWNVRSLRDDTAALASVVRECAPDVMCVQEAPRFARWRSRRAELARSCGLLVATADRTGGLVILTSVRAQVVSTSYTELSRTPRLHRRVVVTATVAVNGVRWQVASMHLGGDPAERARHLPEAWRAVAGADNDPLVVGIDVNEQPGRPVFDELATRLQDAWAVAPAGPGPTASTHEPTRRIDAVFVDRAVTVVSATTIDNRQVDRASDHRPILALLRASGRSA